MSARRPALSAGAVVCALAGVLCVAVACLLFWSAPTLAAAPPVIAEEWVSNVASSSATLQAQIDPEEAETTYRFEYGTSEAYGASAPVPDGSAGFGTSAVPVQAHVQGVRPDTVYHYRVVASNAQGLADGPDETFTTQTAGGAVTLPDGRQWEMVSPPVKEGGEIASIEEEGGLIQAAASGDAITYKSFGPTEANPGGNAYETQILSARGTGGGWSSQDINPPHDAPTGVPVGNGLEYRFFSSDLSLGLVEPFGDSEPPLSAEATERTGYIRDDQPVQPEAGEQVLYREAEEEAQPGSEEPMSRHIGYLPLVAPADVPPGTEFGKKFPLGVSFEGASPDLSHVVLSSEAALTSKAVEGGLYEWSGGRLQLVSVLPGAGEQPVSGKLGAGNGEDQRNAVSADGSRVFWTGGEGHLYMRDTVAGVTVQVDAAQGMPEPVGRSTAVFQSASSDGSRVFFIEAGKLTADSPVEGRNLYECEVVEAVAGEPTCKLFDLTVDPNAGEQAEVQGTVTGASEDGSYVYLVADGVLAEGATPGDNLYVLHESGGVWTTRFITKLSGADANDWSNPPTLSARVSPDGRYLAFMSQRSLTGYDNIDENSGQPDQEVYLYDAVTGHLVCASCDPSGARPVGLEAGRDAHQLINEDGSVESNQWYAADVPGGTRFELTDAVYQSRYLSDSGRLFFNSVAALVPQASNGVADVYEYEPAGVGSCTSSSVTFSPASGGCVALISSGSSGEESVFLDASENGDDVFFLTSARLAGQDLDTAYDVYDAHVCTASSPCPPVTVSPPPCSTADSCRAAPAPQPGVFGAPASATFSGAGNLALAAAGKPAVKLKPKKKKKKKKAKGRGRAKRSAPVRGRELVQGSGKSSSSSSRTGR